MKSEDLAVYQVKLERLMGKQEEKEHSTSNVEASSRSAVLVLRNRMSDEDLATYKAKLKEIMVKQEETCRPNAKAKRPKNRL